MATFKDSALKTSEFFFDLLYAIENRIINWEVILSLFTESMESF